MEWQPIESAPKDGTWILTWTRDITNMEGPWLVVRWNGKEWVDAVAGFYEPTHWQPLPAPPETRA